MLSAEGIEALRRNNEQKVVMLPDGTEVPRLGQGTWFMGENTRKRQDELAALRLGAELGMLLVDTAEMYGDGKSELLVGQAVQSFRDKVFLVSKVYPHNAGQKRIKLSCEESLNRLKTDYLDLYLLHWRGSVPLLETIEGMEELVREGKIRRWGVSNFDTADIKELLSLPNGNHCCVNQVLYHMGSRGIEYDLLPLLAKHRIPVMAYCPLAQAGSLRRGLFTNQAVLELAEKYQVGVAQILLAWCMRSGQVIAIPKAGSLEHVRENAEANRFVLTPEDLEKLEAHYPAPQRKMHLDIV